MEPLAELSSFKVRLAAVPTQPGVYLMRNAEGTIIYVGKAVSLRNRLRSYFTSPGSHTGKVRNLVASIEDFEFIVTDTELEALVLECILIKKHRPKYNVVMKDDKSYPYIKITMNEEWPRAFRTRRILDDGARYFGPYTGNASAWRALELIAKIFPVRTCDKVIDGTDQRPCLKHFIHRCLGPCAGKATREEYLAAIKQVTLFLEGRHDEVLDQIRRKMEKAAEELQFERAAYLRDQIRTLEAVVSRQKVVSSKPVDEDIVGFARSEGESRVEVFFVRRGRLLGREDFTLQGTQEESDQQVLGSFLEQFYDRATYIPPRVVMQTEVEDQPLLEAWLKSRRGGKVDLRVAKRGKYRQLVDMVIKNAAESLEQERLKWLTDEQKTTAAIVDLQTKLGLESWLKRVECYDVSNIQGDSAVGSMVVFEDGKPKKGEYRRFKIKTVEGANDYAMLDEILSRRFKRLGEAIKKEGNGEGSNGGDGTSDYSWATLPDLVIVDGGKGQLSAAVEVLERLKIEDIPVVGLAKENEEIYRVNQPAPLILPRNSESLYLVQRIRDEAHRFAISYHKSVRSKKAFKSPLNDLPGVGPKRKQALLKHFGSVAKIREASVEEIAAVPGMGAKAAAKLKEHL